MTISKLEERELLYFIFFTAIILASVIIGYFVFQWKNKISEKSLPWFGKEYTSVLKGFAILTVVWSHTGAILGVNSIQFIAGIGVSLFLLCSGYGLEKSFKRYGLKGYWKKRFFKVLLPFWFVECVGLLMTRRCTLETYIFDALLIKRATSYGWFVRYIVICYIIFYLVKVLEQKINLQGNKELILLFVLFAGWFVLSSTVFVEPSRPFTEARQMLSFPLGVLIADCSSRLNLLKNKTSLLIGISGGMTGFVFLAITQSSAVKSLPFILSNSMALLTCLPMAVAILAITKVYSGFVRNAVLIKIGNISYEIYLIHAFSLRIVGKSFTDIAIFVFVTYGAAVILNGINQKIISS